MKIYPNLIFALATALLSGSATAGVINTYQFVNNGSAWGTYGTSSGANPGTGAGINLGLSETFTGSNGLEATFTFYENVNKATGAGGTAVNGYHGHGLGVIGATGSSTRVDNDGEAIRVAFAMDVIWKSSFFWGYGNRSEIGVFYWDNSGWSALTSEDDFRGYRTVGLQDTVSDQLLFVNTDVGGANDKWVMKGIAVETATARVPEPGMLGLLAMGLLTTVLAGRRRRVI